MPTNADLARVFERIAQMLELLGADRFRVAAHQRAARAIDHHPTPLADLAGDKSALTAIDGIGAKTADKIAEFFDTGRIAEHDELAAKVPEGLAEVLAIPGLGPKTVRAVWDTLGVESLADLERAIADGSIEQVPRLGRKTITNITEAIDFVRRSSGRVRAGSALPIAEEIVGRLREVPGARRVEHAGSLRRGRDTIGDVDVLASADDPAALRDAFLQHTAVEKILAKGDAKCSVRLTQGGVAIQADLRLVDDEHYGAALMYFTGSKEHNVRMRERAIARGMTLNEYGLFDEPPDADRGTPPQDRGVTPRAARTEHDIYESLGLPFIPPELREDLGEVDDDFEPPELITVDDVRAELHAHTTASDGVMSIAQLAQHAKDRGFHTVAVTDHSVSSAVANGLDPDRLRAHIDAVREADAGIGGISVLAGSEVDILADGSLDYDDELLEQLDVVVASPHAALNQPPADATRRLLRAVEHPLVHVLGHPTGRIINKRAGLEPDVHALAAAAAENGVALEINANPLRLDLRDEHVRIARHAGALIALNCDVHQPRHSDYLRFGVLTARRAALSPEHCINTWTKQKLHKWLRAKRP